MSFPSKATTRAEALADGTFAIVMTLLVIEMHPPSVDHLSEIWGSVWAYMVSFMFLGIYWIAHYNLFHWISGVNHVLLWLNVWFLSMISLVPLSTGFLIENPGSVIAIRWYAAHTLLILIPMMVMCTYVLGKKMLKDEASGKLDRVMHLLSVPSMVSFLTLVLA